MRSTVEMAATATHLVGQTSPVAMSPRRGDQCRRTAAVLRAVQRGRPEGPLPHQPSRSLTIILSAPSWRSRKTDSRRRHGHILSITCPAGASEGPAASSTGQQAERRGAGLMVAYSVERLGEQAWMFATPFLLMAFQSSSHALVGPAVYGISRMFAQALLSPGLGTWMDSMPRMPVLMAGTSIQVASLVAATAVCLSISQNAALSQTAWPFIVICFLGVMDAMGKILTGVAIFRDWIPALFGTDSRKLNNVNTQLARLDLLAEVVGPLAAGMIFQAVGHNMNFALGILAGVRVVCLAVQLRFFQSMLANNPDLEKRTADTRRASDSGSSSNISLLSAWRTFLQHKGGMQLVVVSYALLYLTVLSPHGLVLTAYLSTQSLSPAALSVFRGSGALVGVLGVTAFQMAVRRLELPQAAKSFIMFQALCSVAAAAVFIAADGAQQALLYLFMLLVVLARFGLYAFEVGALQLQQSAVSEHSRGAFGTVEKSMCSAASLVMYAASAAVTGQGGHLFTVIVCTSAVSICAAALVYQRWVTSQAAAQFIAA